MEATTLLCVISKAIQEYGRKGIQLNDKVINTMETTTSYMEGEKPKEKCRYILELLHAVTIGDDDTKAVPLMVRSNICALYW